jgi:D-sedoheptulose 7-phosphate isomerase
METIAKKTNPFSTLTDFSSIIDSGWVLLKPTGQIDLTQGMERAVKLILEVDKKKKKVILIGNGGSASIASHQAIDLWKNGGIKATAFNDASLLTCISNDFSYEDVFAKPMETFADSEDLVIAISSSGKSKNILNATDIALSKGCSVITFSGFDHNNPLSRKGDLNFFLPSNSYGIVEVGHLLLIHSVVDEVIATKKRTTA